METVCHINKCSGCMACINVCPKDAIHIKDCIESYNAIIDKEKCINCKLCDRTCPSNNVSFYKEPILCKQGWAKDDIRQRSSSGGVASAIIYSFIKSGGYVASCAFEEGEFQFILTNDIATAQKFAGSKYVKSTPGKIYQKVNEYLLLGKKVLFIGLPCQSAAIQNVCKNSEKLYTIDLICHGTPSPKILKQYIEEHNIKWDSISDIKFRDYAYFGLEKDGLRFTPRRVIDSYLRAFLSGIDYTENCYSCPYATTNRISDITLGDAWGLLSETESGGVSLILCQTPKGIELLRDADLHIENADLEKAVKANKQLRHPTAMHPKRKVFMRAVKEGYSIKLATIMSLPVDSIKQSIKTGLIKMNILKDLPADRGGGT